MVFPEAVKELESYIVFIPSVKWPITKYIGKVLILYKLFRDGGVWYFLISTKYALVALYFLVKCT
jgi:hypothetical protein